MQLKLQAFFVLLLDLLKLIGDLRLEFCVLKRAVGVLVCQSEDLVLLFLTQLIQSPFLLC